MKKIFVILIKYTILFAMLFLFFLCSAYNFSKYISLDLSSNLLRLHVIANSDSVEDQILKLKVRDSIINYMNSINTNPVSKDDSVKCIINHIGDFKEIANSTINEYGYTYDVSIDITNSDFPTKNYGSIFLPNGNYDALKITIGSGQGKNWWCVLFPPLCFVDSSSISFANDSYYLLQDSLSDEDFSIINKDSTSAEIKFKIIEILNNYTSNPF